MLHEAWQLRGVVSLAPWCRLVLPEIIPLMAITDPIQVLHIFLQKMELLLTKTPTEKVGNIGGGALA